MGVHAAHPAPFVLASTLRALAVVSRELQPRMCVSNMNAYFVPFALVCTSRMGEPYTAMHTSILPYPYLPWVSSIFRMHMHMSVCIPTLRLKIKICTGMHMHM